MQTMKNDVWHLRDVQDDIGCQEKGSTEAESVTYSTSLPFTTTVVPRVIRSNTHMLHLIWRGVLIWEPSQPKRERAVWILSPKFTSYLASCTYTGSLCIDLATLTLGVIKWVLLTDGQWLRWMYKVRQNSSFTQSYQDTREVARTRTLTFIFMFWEIKRISFSRKQIVFQMNHRELRSVVLRHSITWAC